MGYGIIQEMTEDEQIVKEEVVEDEVDDKSTPPVKIKLTKEQEATMYKNLVHKSYKEVGYEQGLHLMYPGDDSKLISVVYNIMQRIRRAPDVWGISPDTVEIVQEALDKRNIKKNPSLKSDVAIQDESFKDKLDGMRDTVAEIITKKLQKYNTKKGIEEVSIRDLKDLLAMAIDKGRLLRGESTENIIKLSRIDVDGMSPDEALKVVIKARDVLVESKK